MAEHSTIEWTDATWNPITGCSVVSPGCTNCYAMRLAGTRLAQHSSRAGLTRDTKAGPVWTGEVRFNDQWLEQPLHWSRPRMIFVCAHADLFHESVPDAWIDKVFAIMAAAHWHTFQVLTKRADRMAHYLRHNAGPAAERWVAASWELVKTSKPLARVGWSWAQDDMPWPLPNVWLGVSAEDQRRADERIPHLLATPAAVRWVSAEPLLGPLDLTRIDVDGHGEVLPLTGWHPEPGTLDSEGNATAGHPGLDWIVAGGESGPSARPMHPDWARALRDQCAAAGVPFHFKQWGQWAPICAMSEEAIDHCYHPAPEHDPEGRRRPKVGQTVLHYDGARFDDVAAWGAFQAGCGAMMMKEIGKVKAGRLLDGREHSEFPR